MRPLRWAAFWRSLGWLLVIFSVVASLVPTSSLPDVSFSDKLGHAVTYGGLTVWFCGIYPRRMAPRVAVALFLVGVAVEGVQSLTESRSPEMADLAANAAGILIGLALSRAGLDKWCAMVESLLGADRASDHSDS